MTLPRLLPVLTFSALLLSACGSSTPSPAGGGGGMTPITGGGAGPFTTTAIDGTIQSWTAPSATTMVYLDAPGKVGTVLTSATVDASGHFVLPLPGPAAITPYLTEPIDQAHNLYTLCLTTGSHIVVTGSAQSTSVSSLRVVSGTTTRSISSVSPTVPLTSGSGTGWIYSTAPVTASGEDVCSVTNSGVTISTDTNVNVSLVQGWNVLHHSVRMSGSAASGTISYVLSVESAADGPSSWKQETP